jgi:Fic family protein
MESAAVIVDAIRSEKTDIDVGKMLKASVEATTSGDSFPPREAVSANFSAALLRYIHHLKLPADPFAGKYRQTQVWLVDPTGAVNADMECPSWDKVPPLMEQLVSDWNRQYVELIGADERLQIAAMAKFFHGLLSIHPFIDGNGRLAREILALQARDLFGFDDDLLLNQGPAYYRALRVADEGEFSELEQLIQQAVDGADRLKD